MEEKKTKHLKYFGIGKILPFLDKVKKLILLMILFGLLGSLTDIIIPLFQRYALDHYIGMGVFDGIVWFVIAYLSVILIAAGSNYIACTLATVIEVRIHKDLRQTGFNHLQTLSFSYFNQNSVGYIHARLMSDTSRIGTLASWILIDGVWHLTYLVGAIVVMLILDPGLTALVLAILPVLVVLFSIFQKKLIHVNREVREINSKITANFNEGITGAKTVKSLAIEEKMEQHFREDTQAIRKKSIHASRLRGLFAGTMRLASSVALSIVLWKGGYIAVEEIGTFSVFMSYAQGMMEPLRWIVDIISDLITTQVNIERFTNLLAVKSDVTDTPEVIEKYGNSFEPKKENWEPILGDIEFRDVTFQYPDGDENVLEHFNLKIPFGSHIAIVGETGAGKSTLVNLVCRFYEPTEGTLLIDGKDARERSQLWLHSAIGYVLQNPHLFSGTVRENLTLVADESEKAFRQALAIAQADFVEDLNTTLGENNTGLSKGQLQRLAIARAILMDRPIFLLDECTSALDAQTEAAVLKGLQSLGKQAILVTHRPEALTDLTGITKVEMDK